MFNRVLHRARVFLHVFRRVSDCRVFHRVFHRACVFHRALLRVFHRVNHHVFHLVFRREFNYEVKYWLLESLVLIMAMVDLVCLAVSPSCRIDLAW